MSVTKDGDTGRWMSQIRVTDWTGKTIHKKKRGFATKKEALQWERDFISQSTGSLGMTFGDFIALYVKDMEHRLKPSTVASKKWLIDLKVTPFFKKIPLNEIKPTHVRQWQNSLTSYRDENGKPYAQTYLKCINNQLTAIFNYAVKYYGLKENPCHKAGSMGKKKADEMLFWTKDEFQTFIESMKDRPASYTVFMTMYYTGIREGELYKHAAEIVRHEFCHKEITLETGRMKKQFASAITPAGIRNHLESILNGCERAYVIQCPVGLDSSRLLNIAAESALYRGMDTEGYYCPMKPGKKLEHLLIPQIKTAFLTLNPYHDLELEGRKEDIKRIDMNDIINWNQLEGKKFMVKDCERKMNELLEQGISCIKEARKEHDLLESYYIPNMDFKKIDALRDEIIGKIEENVL